MATLKELRETAKAYGIKGRSKMSNYELEKAIREHEQAEKETQLVSQLETAHINYFITGKTYIMKSIDGNFSFPFEVTTRNALNEITIAFDNYRIEENNSFVKTSCYSIERAEVKIIDGIEYISYPHVYNRKTGEYMTFTAQTAEAPASTPETFKINPDLAPDFDAAFDECAYTPERQDNLAVLDDIPADHEPDVQKVKITPVQEAKPETTEQPREPWQEHTCDHCNGTPNWTHEQFIRGILLSYERTEVNSKVSEYLPMSRYLTQKYSLAQLHNLAKFFGLNVPAIELTSENKTGQKAYQIANIIADEIGSMEHVYACTYITTGAPDLPAELAEHAPEWEKETIARAQAMPVSVEPEHQQKKHCPLLSLSYWDRHTKSHNEKCRKNRKFIDTLQTVEEITAIMLDFGMKNIFEQAIYDRVHLNGQYLLETDEETTARYAETYAQKIIARRQRKTKTKTRKNAPKPATKKPRHTKKFDDSRQILIQFDEPENTPAPASTPAKPKTHRTRTPRIKRDYSRQILIDFGKDIPDCQNNKRIAA